MKIALVTYPGVNRYELYSLAEPLERLRGLGLLPDLEIETCAAPAQANEMDQSGFSQLQAPVSLQDYAALLVPGGPGASARCQDRAFLDWLRSAEAVPLKVAVGGGIDLLTAAGLPAGSVLQSPASAGALELGLQVVERLAGPAARGRVAAELGLVNSGQADGATALGKPTTRTASVTRVTNETRIQLELNLDGSGQHEIRTGVPFFDHMLTQVAVHGLFDLRVEAQGDLEIDCHHTVEDVALALGKAFDQALGDRKGLVRMGSAYVPMDESLALVVIDLSGRPYSLIEADWNGPEVGGIPTTLFPHFLESFAVQARCNLHARLLAGRDDHHRAEAIFKAFGRALDAATQIDPRRVGAVPSSKGTL